MVDPALKFGVPITTLEKDSTQGAEITWALMLVVARKSAKASTERNIIQNKSINLQRFDARKRKRLHDLWKVIRPNHINAALQELQGRYSKTLWPLHWNQFKLTRAEQDRLVHEEKFREKWPRLFEIPEYAFPPVANAEQASSEATAMWKAKNLLPFGAQKVLDLTGGSGIDTWAFEQKGMHVDCVEPDPYLVELLRWNGRHSKRNVTATTAEQFQPAQPNYDVVYADPSRREKSGQRIDWSDLGTPNPLEHLSTWLSWAPTVILKLSPMVDVRAVQRWFPNADLIAYLSRKREVKELLVRIPRTPDDLEPVVIAADVDAYGTERYQIKAVNTRVDTANEVLEVLHDPDPVLRAAGADTTWAEGHGYAALHPGMSLFTSRSATLAPGGRHFAVESVHDRMPSNLNAASIVTKNFPERAEVLRQKFRIREDSERFLFAIQRGSGSAKSYIVARRIHK